MPVSEINVELIEEHNLTPEEYLQIKKKLGREPNLTELGIFSVMWSEHCSYKSSRVHLKKLPTTGPQVLQGPGENAGVVDIGDGMAAVFKIESHNHPSFIEPYQGAATGVGGILRDVFTMGARPIALMNSLHFGPLAGSRNRHIMEGVVAGIGGYGNCVGVPTVGGEVHFAEEYSKNPLVNAFCLGVADVDGIFLASAGGVGNPVIYVGAKTGRDGIHGATMASEEFNEDSEAKRPTVQVGDPFMEKLLLEACLEAMQTGAVVGIQDMGAAGLTCSSCEMGSNSGTGVRLDLDRVPQREAGMTPYEIMLSESQERMLLVARKGREQEVLSIFEKWDLDAVVIGEVHEAGELIVEQFSQIVARIPNRALTEDAPVYKRPCSRPRYLETIPDWRNHLPPEPEDYAETVYGMLESPHLCSRRWVWEQYDHMVRTGTVQPPGGDSAVIRVPGSRQGLAMCLDSNARLSYLDPRRGAQITVAEACRNLVCSGARPLAATNCLNFANPENPEIMWQFAETVEGMAEACEVFATPITGGNVSFYNETNNAGVLPTPVLGLVGKIDDLAKTTPSGFRTPGDLVYLLGEGKPGLGGSVYLLVRGVGLTGPCPVINLAFEKELQDTIAELIAADLLLSAHDVSEGGLAVALTECCCLSGFGIQSKITSNLRTDLLLFSEHPSRVIVTVDPDRNEEFVARLNGFPHLLLGHVEKDLFRLTVNDEMEILTRTDQMRARWEKTLPEVFRH